MALGGTRERLASMLVGEGMALVGFGLVIGLPAAYGTGRLASSLLYGVSPADAISFAGAAATMTAVGLAACLVPALRIARITPAEALRQD
jgi:ABC-type antimicrobial peptide transport system permease subunit